MIRPILLALALGLSATTALAQPAEAPMDEAALAGHRGGLATAAGLEIGFGASVRTFVDGRLVLQTDLVWTPTGTQTTRSDGAGGAAPQDLSAPVEVSPGTRVIHDLHDDRIASVVINTASDRTIRQQTDIKLELPQLPEIQRQVALSRLSAGLESAAAPFRN